MAEAATPSTTSGPVERAFLVLQHVAAADSPVGVRELGRRTGLPRSTASRLASQLIDLGMLARNADGDLTIGPAIATLQGRDAVPPALEDQLRPLLLDLVDRFGESAALTVDTPGGAHYLAQIPGPSAVQVPDSTGASLPFHQVAPGLVLMAAWSAARLDDYLAGTLDPATPHTPTSATDIRARLAEITSCGWAWAEQALDLEVNGLAVPVRAEGGAVVAAVSLYGPAYRLSPDAAPELAAELAEAVSAAAALALG